MAYSGSISSVVFTANKVVDTAFRRCRLPAQAISAEMQQYALDALYLLLSRLVNPRTLSWCIEQVVLPMYENNPVVTLPMGTVDVLNANYRVTHMLDGTVTTDVGAYTVSLGVSAPAANTLGILWASAAVPFTVQTSNDGAAWTTVLSASPIAAAGEKTWHDIVPAYPASFVRIVSNSVLSIERAYLGNAPQEIPLGQLNRDTYVAQNNKVFAGRPTTYWYQRDLPQPVMNIWPAPNSAATDAQLVVWRQRHIMDTTNLRQEVEVPQRWYDAIVAALAAKVAAETPAVDVSLIPMLEQKASMALQDAYEGDSDSSPTFIQPAIACYTR